MKTLSEEMREQAMNRAREIYPMANEDDYPDNPNVNRLNRACVGAFGNGYSYAAQQIESITSQRDKYLEGLKKVKTMSEYSDDHDQMIYAIKYINQFVQSLITESEK
jgi:hypothetical protein